MKLPTIEECVKAIGVRTEDWKGNCYSISCRIVEAGLVDGEAVYGSWRGPVAEGSFFESGPRVFVRHGWVDVGDGTVIDPTRWVFENVEPYLYHGPSDHYDEGNNMLREALRSPPPAWDPDDWDQVEIRQHELSTEPFKWLEKTLGLDECLMCESYEPGTVTKEQLVWIAHLDPREMEGHAPAIFRYLEGIGRRSMVPIDNWRMMERMERLGKAG